MVGAGMERVRGGATTQSWGRKKIEFTLQLTHG